METKQKTDQPAQTGKQLVKFENISDQVLQKIKSFEQDGGITLPANYSVANALKSAWLVLQETEDRNHKPALEVCTKASIANALLKMAIQGLSVSKSQVYFIVYGNELVCQRSYFGSIALAKRTRMITGDPVANVIYEGDNFVYEIDPKTGLTHIIKHEQKLENIDNSKIRGAYAIVHLAGPSDETQTTVMTYKQIQAAWNQGQTKGQSPAHKGFAEEMSKKTVINRAIKMIVNSSSDAYLYEDGDGEDHDTPIERRNAEVQQNAAQNVISVDEVPFEEAEPVPQQNQNETELQNDDVQSEQSDDVNRPFKHSVKNTGSNNKNIFDNQTVENTSDAPY